MHFQKYPLKSAPFLGHSRAIDEKVVKNMAEYLNFEIDRYTQSLILLKRNRPLRRRFSFVSLIPCLIKIDRGQYCYKVFLLSSKCKLI